MDRTAARSRRPFRIATAATIGLCVALGFVGTSRADVFRFVDRAGNEIELPARLAGSGRKSLALEMADGQWLVIPEGVVTQRTPAADPEPMTPEKLAEKLMRLFRKERFLVHVDKPVVAGLLTAGEIDPADKDAAVRRQNLLKKAAQFQRNVQGTFLSYIRVTRVPVRPIRFPLVMLIFEADRDFEQYAAVVTGNQGLAAANIAGFYDALSNHLVLRLSECETFEVPLHEAIHQQVFNRGILQRLAPIPTWFHEGIATGFEGNGDRIRSGPTTLSDRYARMAVKARVVDWSEIVREDRAFHGNVLAGEAYGHAWGLHWLLVTKYKSKYTQFVRLMASKEPMAEDTAEARAKEFESIVGVAPAALQREFYAAVRLALERRSSAIEDATWRTFARTEPPASPFETVAFAPRTGPTAGADRPEILRFVPSTKFAAPKRTGLRSSAPLRATEFVADEPWERRVACWLDAVRRTQER